MLAGRYNPYLGIGSPIERFKFPLGRNRAGEHVDLFLPESMRQIEGIKMVLESGWSLQRFALDQGSDYADEADNLAMQRTRHDFEFWTGAIAKIKAGRGMRYPDGRVIPAGATIEFWLNRPQRIFLARLEAMRARGEPVRIIVLKHRQWGATTMSFTYIAWHQIELYRDRDAWFIGLNADGSRDVIGRYDMIRENYNLGALSIRPHQGMQNTKIIPERGCTLSAGTVQRPNAPSGRTPQFVHAFEIGKWPSNSSVSAERVMQNIDSMLVDAPGTIGIIESTAQGETGTYFKELCDLAQKGETGYEFLFIRWIDDPQWQRLLSASEFDVFVASWTEYEETLWEMGATVEQINWYRHQGRKPGYVVKPWLLKEEFPSSAEEAFLFGEKRVFPASYVLTMRKTCRDPLLTGDLYADGLVRAGALKNIHFEPNPRGLLRIWRKPRDNYNGRLVVPDGFEGPLRHRYMMASDVGGQWKGADFSVCTIGDRAPLLWGGFPEIVAEWRGHEDPTLFAWICARLGFFYSVMGVRSQLVPAYWIAEVNSFQAKSRSSLADEDQTPNYGITVIEEIKDFYPLDQMYYRQVLDKTRHEFTGRPGWWTDQYNKPVMVSALMRAVRGFYDFEVLERRGEGFGLVERSEQATLEMDTFLHVGGRMEAAPKKKDDCVITRSLLCFADQNELEAPSYVKQYKRPKRVVSAARL